LPPLYREFCRTHESRHGDEIRRLVQAVLMKLAETPEATGVAQAVLSQIQALHERLGLLGLNLKPLPPPKRPRPRKTA
jgi:hypothetical protein